MKPVIITKFLNKKSLKERKSQLSSRSNQLFKRDSYLLHLGSRLKSMMNNNHKWAK